MSEIPPYITLFATWQDAAQVARSLIQTGQVGVPLLSELEQTSQFRPDYGRSLRHVQDKSLLTNRGGVFPPRWAAGLQHLFFSYLFSLPHSFLLTGGSGGESEDLAPAIGLQNPNPKR